MVRREKCKKPFSGSDNRLVRSSRWLIAWTGESFRIPAKTDFVWRMFGRPQGKLPKYPPRAGSSQAAGLPPK